MSVGDISKSADIARVMVGHDVAINAAGTLAGTVTEGSAFTQLVQTVVDSAIASLGEGGRLWQFGGAAVLNVPGTHLMAVDLPKVPKVYEAHRTNLDALRRSPLDWSMLCPGPMISRFWIVDDSASQWRSRLACDRSTDSDRSPVG